MNKELMKFLANLIHRKEEDISCGNIRLEKDLYIYGEDAERLLIEYSNFFNVDISNLDFSKYFTGEVLFSYTFYRSYSKRYKQKKDLTIGDLERGIIYGFLNDEIISASSS